MIHHADTHISYTLLRLTFALGEIKQSYLKHLRVRFKVLEFNVTFNNISVILWRQFYWWRNKDYLEKTTDLVQVTDRLSHNVVSSTPRLFGIRIYNVGCDRH